MRTAEEYISWVEMGIHFYGDSARHDLADVINEARKEAITEAAKKVWFEPYTAKKILSLINELK